MESSGDSVHSDASMKEDAQSSNHSNKQRMHPPPNSGSLPNVGAPALQANRCHVEDGNCAMSERPFCYRPMHEIPYLTVDKPKLLSELTSLLAEIGLNIQEAHAFSTSSECMSETFRKLRNTLEKEISKYN